MIERLWRQVSRRPARESPLNFTLIPGASVTGSVRRRDGTPVAGTLVRAWPKRWEYPPFDLPNAMTGSDGSFRLDHLVPGPTVVATAGARQSLRAPSSGDVTCDLLVT